MKRALFCVLFVITGLVPAGSALAAPIHYALQIGHSRPAAFVLDGDQLTGLTIDVAPQGCATGDPRNSSDSLWRISIGPADRVSLSGGRFLVSGEAPSAYYPGGSADFTVSGTVTQDHRLVTGTITIANGHDPFVSGCSATNTFLAVPEPTRTAGWGAPKNRTFTSQFLSFDYHAGVVSRLVLQANFHCGSGPDPSVDEAEIDAAVYGYPSIHASRAGSWSLHAYVLDEYGMIKRIDVAGQIGPRTASGRIVISEPPGLVGVAGQGCSGNYRWRATRPTPPPPPGPTAFFNWKAVRVPAGAAYRYYFYITDLRCTSHATGVELKVASYTTRITCAKGQGWASRPLTPGRTYTTKAQAIHLVNGHVIRRGTAITEPIQMPGPGDYWRVIGPLPGTPPA